MGCRLSKLGTDARYRSSDIKRQNQIYQLPLIFTTLLHVDLINVAYLTTCAFIRSS